MDIGEILSDSLRYPALDYTNWLIFGVILLISSLTSIFGAFGIYNSILYTIFEIISFIVFFIILGYGISVLKRGIDLVDEIPDLNIVGNFVDGLKVFVTSIVYFIIPIIVSLIVAVATGVFTSIYEIAPYIVNSTAATSTSVVENIPQDLILSLFSSMLITCIVAIILFIIFGFFYEMALCRLAKYDSLGEALSMGEAIRDVKRVGVLKLIGFEIIMWVISAVIGLILAVVFAIPFIGVIIALLVGYSYIFLFNYRALGLLYSDV